MIVLLLGLVLGGGVMTVAMLWLTGASWWMIALGYLLGGWAGLLLGLPVLLLLRHLRCRRTAARYGPAVRHPLPAGMRPGDRVDLAAFHRLEIGGIAGGCDRIAGRGCPGTSQNAAVLADPCGQAVPALRLPESEEKQPVRKRAGRAAGPLS